MSKVSEVKRTQMPHELTEQFDPARFRVYRTSEPTMFDIGWGGKLVGMIRWIDLEGSGQPSHFLGSMAVEEQSLMLQETGESIEIVMHRLIDNLESRLVYVSPKFLNG